MSYLEGRQVPFKTASDRKKLLGKYIRYLRKCDIDKSGRGFFFPRTDLVIGTRGSYLTFDGHSGVSKSDLVEVVVIEEQEEEK